MRTFIATSLLLIAASASAEEPPSVFDQTFDAGLRPGLIVRLDEVMQQKVEQKQIAGVAILIARDGKIGYDRAYGFRDLETKEPMTRDTIFAIASMTKPMVAVTAMTLWEEGKFKLDDPISDVLPEWKDIKVRQGDELVPAEKPITPRMLMTHSSGMDDEEWGKWSGPPGNPYAMTSDEFSKTLAARPLLDQPGTKYRYGFSIGILGRYLEVLEGKSLDVVMQQRVFGPLELTDTGFWIKDKEDLSRFAAMYAKDADGKLVPRETTTKAKKSLRLRKPARMEGSGSLHSTLGDYYRFAQMLTNKGELDGTRILKPETVELMFQIHLPKEDDSPAYGLGAAVDGKGYYTWGGAFGTRFWANSRDKSCGVFMIQTRGDSESGRIFHRLGERATTVP